MTIEQGAGSTDQQGIRVLAIDDDERVTRLITDHLEMRAWSCVTAPDGNRGFALAQGGGFDLVLLDLGLPGMDGLAVLRELRRLAPDVPVIVMTGSGTAENAIRALRHGATDFITKPFHLRTLDEALDRCLGPAAEPGEPAAGRASLSRSGGTPTNQPALHRSVSTIMTLLESHLDDNVHTTRGGSSSSGGPNRVVALADALARSLALPEADARTLRWAARLASMTDADLAALDSVGNAARVALLRTARWDGANAPHGLRGEAIPMPSRCLAVAESVVAAASERGTTPDAVRGVLRNGSGTRFDPAVVEVCAGLPGDVLANVPDARPTPMTRRAAVVAP